MTSDKLHRPGDEVNLYSVLPAPFVGHGYLPPAAPSAGEKKDPKEPRIDIALP